MRKAWKGKEVCGKEEKVPSKVGEVLVLEIGVEMGAWSQKRAKDGQIR